MAPPRIAINGFGRVGRLVARSLMEREGAADLVAVNDLAPADELAYLFEFDSVHGRLPTRVESEERALVVGDRRIVALSEKDPAKLPWRDLRVDYVVDATGKFRTQDALRAHLDAGAKRVVLTAPGKDVDVSLVRGVNMDAYDPAKHRIVSNSSCTTNCLAPILKVLDEAFGVEQAVMTTVHAYTNGQRLLDATGKDARRSRAAALNIIPTTTGAAQAIGEVMPRLKGKVTGLAVRVPVPNVSMLDLTAKLAERITREDLEDAFDRASESELAGILGVDRRPLVSTDYNHDPRSAIVDATSLTVVDGSLVKVLAWYDNEWAYAVRTAEVVLHLAALDARASQRAPAQA